MSPTLNNILIMWIMYTLILTLDVAFRGGEISSAENIIIVQMDPLVQVRQVFTKAETDRISGNLGQCPEDQLPVGGHI